MTDYTDLIASLKEAPDTQLDKLGVAMVNTWSNPPSPEQILELLDNCVCWAWCSDFVVRFLRILLEMRCKDLDITYQDVVEKATWRPLV